MKLLRKLLFPFVPLYYLATYLRNKFFDLNILKSKQYSVPVICIGNLSVGGTGKTPMIEFLLSLLSYKVATLSRGYKRSTKGFLLSNDTTKVNEIGDEPFQFKQKFKDVLVAVDEDRQRGIETLLELENPPEVILLDDAYQHRKVNAGFNILLTTFDNLYINDCMLPTGDLREPKSGAKRAHVVVVTKCPNNLNEIEKTHIAKKLRLKAHQQLFFSWIVYDDFLKNDKSEISFLDLKNKHFTLVTGIANANPLIDFLNEKALSFEHLNFKDHHNFTNQDIEQLNKKELIVTTEKDFVRLKNRLQNQALYYLPIKVKLDDKSKFEGLIKDFINFN